MTAKTPRRPTRPLEVEDGDVVDYGGPLWRIHPTSGDYPSRWDEHRVFGPLASRWDPHPTPTGTYPGFGVLYAATDPTTAFGEVFQSRRTVDLHEQDRYLSGWVPGRSLRLLNLTDTWAVRQGAGFALTQAPKSTCRAWAREIHAQLVLGGHRLDGLWTRSTVTGRDVVVLFDTAVDTYPTAPEFTRPLHHDDLVAVVDKTLEELRYGLAAAP